MNANDKCYRYLKNHCLLCLFEESKYKDWQGGEGDVVEREVDAVEERLRGEAVEECVVELTREARHIL